MGDRPNGRYHICRIGRAQGDGYAWHSPRADAVVRYGRSGFSRTAPEILVQDGGKARQGRPSPELLLRSLSLRVRASRSLTGCGHSCIVVARSLIPMKSGDRVKTDRREAVMLAKLHRAGETNNRDWIPDAAHEAIRDLVRARATAGRVLSKARQHLQGFLSRHDRFCWEFAPGSWLIAAG